MRTSTAIRKLDNTGLAPVESISVDTWSHCNDVDLFFYGSDGSCDHTTLSPDQARELAVQLERAADAAETEGGEDPVDPS